MAAKTENGEESDGLSTSSEPPPDWNSDDEPPQDQEGDEHTCSRDGAVKRTIRKVGRGLERPGQYDFVRLRVKVLQLDSEDTAEPTGQPSTEELAVQMGQDQLPLAIEFAVKSMRVGEIAEVRGPAAYSVKASPLTGRRLRSQAGALPKQPSKVPRKLRFSPVAPQAIALKAKADLEKANKAKAAEVAAAAQRGSPPAVIKPPMYLAEVELLELQCVHMLTEDQSVSKRLVQAGRSRRQPRLDDVVTFSLNGTGTGDEKLARYTLTLGEDKLPYPGLCHVLLSMKEGEHCIARLSSTADRDCAKHGGIVELDVTLHRWRRRDLVPMPPLAGLADSAIATGDSLPSSSSSGTCLRKTELHPGPERKEHDIEAGSMVLVGLAPDCANDSEPMILSWRIGEDTVPRYLESAVISMRLAEGSVFEVPEAARSWPPGPSYDGQTPLRMLRLEGLGPLLGKLLALGDTNVTRSGDVDANTEDGQGEVHMVRGYISDLENGTHHEQPYQLPSDWAALGDPQAWDDLPVVKDSRFRLALLDASEALDIGLLEDADQIRFLELERSHGNALARASRFSEASAAYSRALDAVRRTAFYKALFPTERGYIQGAYSRDAGEVEKPILEGLTPEELSARRTSLVALHLNLSLCACKAGKYLIARRHADTALGAEPDNAKALFRRGQAAAAQGDYEDALSDLHKAAEHRPQDRAIRSELHSVQQKLRDHKETQKSMFQNVFHPAARTEPSQT